MKDSLLIYVCATGPQAPEWIRILPLGQVELRDNREPFITAREDLEKLIEIFREEGVRLVIDYEHQSLSGDKAPAAGWITDLEIRDDGLYARVDWTEEARREIESKRYDYYSPAVKLDPKTRRVTKLMHAGLTNNPAIKRLPSLLAAKYGGEENEILVLRDFTAAERKQAAKEGLALPDGSFPIKTRADVSNAIHDYGRATDKEAAQKHIIARAKALNCMDLLPADWPGSTKKPTDGGKPMKAKLLQVLALKAEATDDEALAALEIRLKLADSLPEIATAAGLKPEATVSEIKGTVMALREGHGELVDLKTKVATLEANSAQEKAQAAVAEAVAALKISPAEAELELKNAVRDLPEFKARMAIKTPILAAKELKTPKGGGGKDGLDAEQMTMCTIGGIKPEAFKASRDQLIEQGLLKEEG